MEIRNERKLLKTGEKEGRASMSLLVEVKNYGLGGMNHATATSLTTATMTFTGDYSEKD